MSTHIDAPKGAIADVVLLPGDPLRAQYIAEHFLEKAVRYNTVRNAFGYTGTFEGRRISVQATGMGIPSISIYVNELIQDYGVKTLIRVGTAGGMGSDVKVRESLSGICCINTVKAICGHVSAWTYAWAAKQTNPSTGGWQCSSPSTCRSISIKRRLWTKKDKHDHWLPKKKKS